MSAGPELRAVAVRSGAFSLLREHADLAHCTVAVFDADGGAISGDGPMTAMRPRCDGVAVVVDGPHADAGRACGSAVRVFDRLVGYVVVVPSNGSAPNGVPSAVAARGATVLSDLCTREFELNDLAQEILGAYEELNLFYELSADFAMAADAESIARMISRKAMRVLRAARAWVLLADPTGGTLRAVAAHDPPAGPSDLPAGAGAAGRAMASRQPDLVDDVTQAPPGALAGWERCATHGILTVPICVAEREDRPALGVLQIVGSDDTRAFTAADLKLATALASHAAVLIENQRLIAYERELRIARSIQQSLLPASPPVIDGLDVAGRCVAAESVGGDYYDHFVAANGVLSIVVADVSGHDLAAALIQTTARATVRAQAAAGGGPAAVLDGANRALYDDLTRADMFLTAWFATIDPATGRVVHGDAGHLPALVYRSASGCVDEVSAGGLPIGVAAEGDYVEGHTVLEPGDVLLAYTDGLLEARSPVDGEEYGVTRLAASLCAASPLPAVGIADALLADIARYDGAGSAADDRSLIVVKMRERPSR